MFVCVSVLIVGVSLRVRCVCDVRRVYTLISSLAVPATASPPSVVRPSDVGGKMPPLTFPKTPSVHHLSISEENKDTVMDRAKGESVFSSTHTCCFRHPVSCIALI